MGSTYGVAVFGDSVGSIRLADGRTGQSYHAAKTGQFGVVTENGPVFPAEGETLNEMCIRLFGVGLAEPEHLGVDSGWLGRRLDSL
jgi:hypothetical protein